MNVLKQFAYKSTKMSSMQWMMLLRTTAVVKTFSDTSFFQVLDRRSYVQPTLISTNQMTDISTNDSVKKQLVLLK